MGEEVAQEPGIYASARERDGLARKFAERVRDEGMTPDALFARLHGDPGIEKEMIHYVPGEGYEDMWNPHVIDEGGRKLLCLTNDERGGPRLGVEALRLGLMMAQRFEQTGDVRSNGAWLVPYIRFRDPKQIHEGVSEENKVDGIGGVRIVIFEEWQAGQIEEILERELVGSLDAEKS